MGHTPHTWANGEVIAAAPLNALETDLAAATDRANHTGTQSADTITDGTTNKAYTVGEKTKLAGVAAAATANANDAQLRDRSTHTGTQTSTTVSDFTEAAQDAAVAMFRAGTNVTFTYDDAGNTFTINASGGGAGTTDPEVVRDTIGGALAGGANIQITVNDAADTITIAVTGLANVATTGSYTDLTNKPTSNIASGTTAGQVPVWDGSVYQPTTPGTVTATDVGAVPASNVGAASGVASLDSTTKVPTAQLGSGTAAAGSYLDGGTRTWTALPTGSGGGTTTDALGFASTVLAGSTSNTVITAGRIWFARVTRGAKTGATKVGLQVGVASGNIMVAIYASTGTGTAALPGALKGSSVVTACPTAGYGEITLQAATDIALGDYLAFWCDNATATFAYLGNNAATHKAVSCYNDAGTGITAMPAGPITAASINGFSRAYALTGV